ncbi:MAG: hypothetical protein KKD01_01255 [Proteobacteria bacterium]|nr:hypothetical protein [Pseudomonadota bacterium]MBU1418269.1 hypothetical protein [Pseudomonadota bacterium]MBU1453327.1 hypothetical protein [Pseudomonadota bacterium]
MITNVHVYGAIAEESFKKMKELSSADTTTNENGQVVKKIDWEQKCFKQAMISIVFTGIWLEALLHIKIVKEFDETTFKKNDFKPYRTKLELLGVDDDELFDMVDNFQRCRKELVHEKAYLDNGEIRIAQAEAESANKIIKSVAKYLLK